MKEKKSSPLSHLSIFGYNKQKPTEQDILNGVKNSDDKMFRYIYKTYFYGIRTMVFGFHSLALDADDVFQDGLVAVSRNVMEGKFKGDSSFKTYLTGICRNICLKQMKFASNYPAAIVTDIEDEKETVSEALIERLIILKDKMDEECRQIFDLRFGFSGRISGINIETDAGYNARFQEIATVLKIECDTARQRFRRCLEKLKKAVFKDPESNEIITSKYKK